MKALLIRSTQFDVAGDGRTIEGMAFEWERPAFVEDPGAARYLEEFDRRSAEQTLRMRGHRPVFVEHEHILGSVGETQFTPASEGLMFRARATDSIYAAQTMARVNAGELTAVSIGFRPIRSLKRSDPRGTVTRRAEISIEELSLAREGQHPGGQILAVRSVPATPRLDELRRQRSLLLI